MMKSGHHYIKKGEPDSSIVSSCILSHFLDSICYVNRDLLAPLVQSGHQDERVTLDRTVILEMMVNKEVRLENCLQSRHTTNYALCASCLFMDDW